MTPPRKTTRGRRLTPEEAARYAAIRQQIELEKPEIVARSETRLLQAASIGHRFREAREDAGLTLAAVSQRTGIDSSTLSRFESGQRCNPTLSTLSRLAEALGLSIDLQFQPIAANSGKSRTIDQ